MEINYNFNITPKEFEYAIIMLVVVIAGLLFIPQAKLEMMLQFLQQVIRENGK